MVRRRNFKPGWQWGENGSDAKKDPNDEILFEAFSRMVLKSPNERIVCMPVEKTMVPEIRYDALGAMLSKSGISSLKAGLSENHAGIEKPVRKSAF